VRLSVCVNLVFQSESEMRVKLGAVNARGSKILEFLVEALHVSRL